MYATKIVNLFEKYRAAFKSYNLNQVVKFYHLPCTLHTPDKVVLLSNPQDCKQELSNIFEQLKQAQTNEILARKASYSVVTDNLLLASVDWEFLDEKGEIFADFCAVYHLALIDTELKIINVVSHDLSNSLLLQHPLELRGENLP